MIKLKNLMNEKVSKSDLNIVEKEFDKMSTFIHKSINISRAMKSTLERLEIATRDDAGPDDQKVAQKVAQIDSLRSDIDYKLTQMQSDFQQIDAMIRTLKKSQ